MKEEKEVQATEPDLECESQIHKITGFCMKHTVSSLKLFSTSAGEKLHNKWIGHKGYMTRQGEVWNYHEWHAAIYSTLLVSAGFVHPVFFGIWAWVLVKVLTKDRETLEEKNKLLKEIHLETGYFIGHGAIAAIVLAYFLGVPDVQSSMAILEVFVAGQLG